MIHHLTAAGIVEAFRGVLCNREAVSLAFLPLAPVSDIDDLLGHRQARRQSRSEVDPTCASQTVW